MIILDMITGAPRAVMLTFFGIGTILTIFSFWALYLTDIPLEQFEQDPRFKEEYIKYHQWLIIFGVVLVMIGGVVAGLGRRYAISRR